jgi:hypothetical protein
LYLILDFVVWCFICKGTLNFQHIGPLTLKNCDYAPENLKLPDMRNVVGEGLERLNPPLNRPLIGVFLAFGREGDGCFYYFH